ncbi:MAG: purine-binding chemotaxis protein CheW [Nitrospirae bacterium]|nr:purine-binding chemotaxis protein CheW [Nitrospirota bacterium]
MDISKIRKKAKAKEAERKAEEKAGETPVGSSDDSEAAAAEAPQEPEEYREAEEDQPAGAGSADAKDEKEPEKAGDEEGSGGEKIIELLTFTLSNEEYAFRVSEVEEIVRYQRITRVPTTPAFVKGITSLRGKIIPVMDLKTRLSLEQTEKENSSESYEEVEDKRSKNEKILILGGPQGLIGATIDKVMGVVRMPETGLLNPPAHLSEEELKYIEGVVILDKRFISVIRAGDALNIEGS